MFVHRGSIATVGRACTARILLIYLLRGSVFFKPFLLHNCFFLSLYLSFHPKPSCCGRQLTDRPCQSPLIRKTLGIFPTAPLSRDQLILPLSLHSFLASCQLSRHNGGRPLFRRGYHSHCWRDTHFTITTTSVACSLCRFVKGTLFSRDHSLQQSKDLELRG